MIRLFTASRRDVIYKVVLKIFIFALLLMKFRRDFYVCRTDFKLRLLLRSFLFKLFTLIVFYKQYQVSLVIISVYSFYKNTNVVKDIC